MAEHSSIEWTDATWNPIRGCTRVSPGCGGPGPHGGCYAEGIAARFSGPGQAYEGIAEMRGGKPRWTGNLSFGHDLDAPLRWRRPRRIFVNSMSDLFHEGLPVPEIATIFGVCIAAYHLRGHISQTLTKRSGRMCEVLADPAFWDQVNAEAGAHILDGTDPLNRRRDDARATLGEYGPAAPPPGIWLGVSAEDQQRADERRDDLAGLAASGWLTFASYEPALGPIDWRGWEFLCWLISGGENGPRSRPSHPAWHRAARDFCAPHGIAYFFKQWGAWGPHPLASGFPVQIDGRIAGSERDFGDVCRDDSIAWMDRIGKKAAGRLLDDVEHNGMPEALV